MTSRSKTWPSLEPTFVHRADPPGNGQFVVWPPLSSMISCTFAPAKSTCAAVMPHSACAVPTNQQSCNSVRISPRPRTIEANVRARTQESAPIRYDPHDVVLTVVDEGKHAWNLVFHRSQLARARIPTSAGHLSVLRTIVAGIHPSKRRYQAALQPRSGDAHLPCAAAGAHEHPGTYLCSVMR